MNRNQISTKTGGINDATGYYLSACCRSEVFLEEGARKPRCPACGGATEWGMTLWRVAESKPILRKDARRSERHAAPEGFPRLSRVEWGGFAVNDIRVVNYSSTGIAVEVADPAIFFGEVKLTLGNGALVSGMIRHCRPRETMWLLGICCDLDLPTLGLNSTDVKAN